MTVALHPLVLEGLLFPNLSRYECNVNECGPGTKCERKGNKKAMSKGETKAICPVDLIEREDCFIVKADLPGFKKEEISLSADPEGQLQILAQVPTTEQLAQADDQQSSGEKVEEIWHLCERLNRDAIGRTIRLPREACLDNVQASFIDGVLEVRLPKERPTKRQIQIN